MLPLWHCSRYRGVTWYPPEINSCTASNTQEWIEKNVMTLLTKCIRGLQIMNSFIFNCFNLSFPSVSHTQRDSPSLPPGIWLQFVLHLYSVGKLEVSKQWVGSVYAFRLQSCQTNLLQFLLMTITFSFFFFFTLKTHLMRLLMFKLQCRPEISKISRLTHLSNSTIRVNRFLMLYSKNTCQR